MSFCKRSRMAVILVRIAWRSLPCIFMTGCVDRPWLRQVQSLRVVDVLTKPVSRELITRTVRFALQPQVGFETVDVGDG